MTDTLTLRPIGVPAPQGSKSGFYNKNLGRVQLVESSKKVKPWRQDVIAAASNAIAEVEDWVPLVGPIEFTGTFFFTRPGYHWRTGKRAGELKPNAPVFVDKTPDLDKIIRSTLDGLAQAGVYGNDSQVARLASVEQLYAAPGVPPGALITLTCLSQVRPLSPVVSAQPTTGTPTDTAGTPTQALF